MILSIIRQLFQNLDLVLSSLAGNEMHREGKETIPLCFKRKKINKVMEGRRCSRLVRIGISLLGPTIHELNNR